MNNNSKPTQDYINIFSTYYYHQLINHPPREINQSSTTGDKSISIPNLY